MSRIIACQNPSLTLPFRARRPAFVSPRQRARCAYLVALALGLCGSLAAITLCVARYGL